jgi:flagellin FlaB
MFKAFTRKLRVNQKGITGLETAIILIAFVVVAAVFAYAVLSAGLYSSQKSQEAVYTGLNEAQSSTVLKGAVIAVAENTGSDGYLSQLTFTLSNTIGGESIDFTPPLASGTDGKAPDYSPNKVVISYIDQYQKVDDLFWTLTPLGNSNTGNLLGTNELFQITIGNAVATHNGGNLADALPVHHLGINTQFTIQITTPVGSTLTFERTTPPNIETTMDLN